MGRHHRDQEKQQHSKGKARPRRWHHGKAQGRLDADRLAAAQHHMSAAEGRAQAHEGTRKRMVADIDDHGVMMRQLAHVAPFVPSW